MSRHASAGCQRRGEISAHLLLGRDENGKERRYRQDDGPQQSRADKQERLGQKAADVVAVILHLVFFCFGFHRFFRVTNLYLTGMHSNTIEVLTIARSFFKYFSVAS